MKVAFRADASLTIGSGHVMRCLTLADEMRNRGAQPIFICRELQGNLISFIESQGYPVARLDLEDDGSACWEADAQLSTMALLADGGVEWLVVDSYRLGAAWEASLRTVASKLFVIDDLADRLHDCDVLLDQNFYVDAESRYGRLTPESCRRLLGPVFTLLRTEFAIARANLRIRDGIIRRILVFFGGSDLGNETLKTLQALLSLKHVGIAVDLVVGLQNTHRHYLETFAALQESVTVHFQVSNMAELLAAADLYVGAAGTTTWERCCLGLPSLVITVADNQVQATKDLDQLGVLTYLGNGNSVAADQIAAAVEGCILSPARMIKQAEKGLALVDGHGAFRCAEAIIHYSEGDVHEE